MVSMARPLLADPYWVRKASEGRVDEINTCIGCNQVQIALQCSVHYYTLRLHN
jgi:2,4-dienoyl-CoA reductase-like NADH-dependent reductase (Old Yellow Enzyme family)